MHNYLKYLAAAAMLLGSLSAAAVRPNIEKGREADANRWADSVYATLTERQRVAQLLCCKVVPTQGVNSKAAITRLVKTDGIGGLLFTEGTIEQYASLADFAQSEAKVRC